MDKTMDDKIIYIPNDNKQNNPIKSLVLKVQANE